MKEEMKKSINEALRIKARELADEEGRGYIEAEWLQTQDIGLDINVENYIEDASEKGYRPEDIKIGVYTSTHSAWYGWIGYRLRHPLLGESDSNKVVFPNRSRHTKAFAMPLYGKEIAEEKEREKIKLKESLKRAVRNITALREELDESDEARLRNIVNDGEFQLDDVTYTIETQGID